ncbi:MAG: ATP-binding protein [Phycisphaerales bacterium JB040]
MRPDPELFDTVRKILEHPGLASLLAEHSGEMLYVQDEDGRTLTVSPSVETLTGYPPDEFMVRARDILDLNSPRTRAVLARWAEAKRAETGALIGPYLIDITHRDGRRRTHSVRERWFEDGGRRLLAGIARDVTELTFSEHAYRHVLSSAGLVNYYGEYTEDGPRLVYLSEGFGALYNVAPEKALRDPRRFMDSVHPEDRERLREAVEPIWRGDAGRRWSLRFRIVHDDGSVRWLHSRGLVEHALDGSPHHYMGVSEDITEQVLEQEQRRQADARLADSQKIEAVGQLAAGITHSFSNLLLAIQSYLGLARTTLGPGHPALEALDRIQDSADQARGITSSLLSFSKRRPTKSEPVDLSGCVENAARLLQRSLPARVRVTHAVEPGLVVHADSATLTQVLLNMAINARDAIDGSGEFALRLTREGDEALLVVSDTGRGMDADTLAHCFEPFFTTKDGEEGTGLGLSVSRSIIEEIGGTIGLDSAPGRGARFEIRLPLTPGGRAPRDEGTPGEPGAHPAFILHPRGLARRVIKTTLRSLGFAPDTFETARELLEAAERGPPELLVIEGSGAGVEPGLLERLDALAPEARIVLITDRDDDPAPARLDGRTVTVPTPFTMDDLSSAVARTRA